MTEHVSRTSESTRNENLANGITFDCENPSTSKDVHYVEWTTFKYSVTNASEEASINNDVAVRIRCLGRSLFS